jgi:xanthine dehydrogenase accessory factor
MSVPALDASSVIEPIRQLAEAGGAGVLCVITHVDGPSYRPLGAMMAVMDDGRRVGTLSSGCVEADIALHAGKALESGAPYTVRYGKGSPFADIVLPCGGGLEIMLVPRPDVAVLQELLAHHLARQACVLEVSQRSGNICAVPEGRTGWTGDVFSVAIEPEIYFFIFGKGPETSTFAGLVQAAGYPNLVLSPDEETLAAVAAAGCATRHLTHAHCPEGLGIDNRSAVVLFFHDHEWEPPILAQALASDALYIGAQGSMRAAEMRRMELHRLGVSDDALARLKGPIGLVPSVRDARKLAVSVLAEVLSL